MAACACERETASWCSPRPRWYFGQLEYKHLIVWNAATGWAAYFDYCPFVLCVLKRMGYWIRRSWRPAAAENNGTDADAEALHGTVTVDAAGWRTLATPALAALLDAVHTFAALTNRLLSATLVVEPDASTRVELHAHHREASLDDYYVNAMLADLPLGSIVQYAHRFQFLFHSITQVRPYSPRSPLCCLTDGRPAPRRAPRS